MNSVIITHTPASLKFLLQPNMVSLIVAHSKNGVIGKNGSLPWHISDDLNNFKKLTSGHTVIMGRKTFESIGRPLPNRRNVVISRQRNLSTDDAKIVPSLEEAIKMAGGDQEIFIIGGGEIYKLALPFADRVYATQVETEINGDTYFPALNLDNWQLSSFDRRHDDKADLDYSFTIYDRRKSPPKLYFIDSGRSLEQITQMEDLESREVCVFCEKHFKTEHREPIEIETSHWLVTKNDYPYEHTKLHLLIVPKEHVNLLSKLSKEALAEYAELLPKIEQHYKLTSYSQFMRVGDFRYNGASIYHLHSHIVVADHKHPEFDKLKVKLGSKPKPVQPKSK